MMKKGKDGFYAKYIKRILDIICALAAMIVFCWLYVIIAVLVRVALGSPVIFTQERPGKIDPKTGKEKIFKLYKFRSMTDARDDNGVLLPDSERLTKFGRILRATSLDELPEAWNILKGDMSVIGPRPWLVKYLDYYGDFERKRQYVRPGLSGLAQVNGRNAATWGDRFRYDSEYVDNISFLLDVKIVARSVKKLFCHDDVEFTGRSQTMAEYFAEKDAVTR